GNGVAGAFAGDLYRAMGCEVTELFCEVDGHFPNHHPDPAHPENLQDLIRCLQTSDAEIGLAFDGDGDRLGVVTKDGQIIYPDRQLMLFAADVLSRHQGEQILYDVKCTRHLSSWIKDHGGVPLMWKTGHSLVKAKLKETGSPLGGEMSGHVFFKDRWYGFDDGMYAGARLLEILSKVADMTATLNDLPQSTSTPELQLKLNEGENFAIIAEMQKNANFPGSTEIINIDGLRVEYPDGFGLARSSNTTPVIVMRFEAETPEALLRIQSALKDAILAVKPDALLPY
uniref:phosphomannomutase/phosphoglucomutase n=1 Tax=Undibacterium sp. TaxID=1914977 RepID=UPI00375083B6